MANLLKKLLKGKGDALGIVSTNALPWRVDERLTSTPAVMFNPYLAAKFRPYRPELESYVYTALEFGAATRYDSNHLPVPPADQTVYKVDYDWYISSGRETMGTIRSITESSGFSFKSAGRVLDFGCADGRIIRWFYDLLDHCEVWGVDILGEFVMLCQQYLSPPFRFATTTSLPHLPFEDRSFDFIYAGSVFTHIVDLADAWLLELKRVLRPRGRLYITIHDEHTIALCSDPERRNQHPVYRCLWENIQSLEKQKPFLGSAYNMFTVHRAPGPGGYREAQVFYKTDYLRQHWGSMLNVLSVTPQAHFHQSAILMEKPAH